MKKLIFGLSIILIGLLIFSSCGGEAYTGEGPFQCPMKCEGEKLYAEFGSCPVCHMDLKTIERAEKVLEAGSGISPESIFNLTSKWNTQHNETIELKDLKGDVLVMVMIYTSCKAACPRLVADMRSIHEKVDDNSIRYILVSIDPETDTPERLKEFAIENQMDNDSWTFLQGTVDDVREFSNILSVKYKQISPIDFSHSNIISVFDKEGVLYHQQEGLGVDNEETVAKIKELTE